MLAVLLSLIYLFDTIELHRRASKYDGVPLSLLLKMGLLKLPEVGQMVFPFAVLFSAMFTFWKFTRRYELIVMRSSGFSVWQFLSPILAVAVLFGMFQISVVNPLGALLLTKFEHMEHNYLAPQKNLVTLSREGLWLRQPTEEGHAIIYAKSVRMPEWILKSAMVLNFDRQDVFLHRVDASDANLHGGYWLFKNAVYNDKAGNKLEENTYQLKTDLTISEIEDSFSSPETMSFWTLPSFINTMENTGFDSTRLRIYFHSLLSQPLLFAAMILLAASVSLRPPRSGGTMLLVVMGVIIGFIVFFVSSFLKALGASHQVPVALASWSPALITMLFGVAVMLNLEDG